MATEAPRQPSYFTVTETIVVYFVLGSIGYSIHGKLGLGYSMILATLVIAQAIWRSVRNVPGVIERSSEEPNEVLDGMAGKVSND